MCDEIVVVALGIGVWSTTVFIFTEGKDWDLIVCYALNVLLACVVFWMRCGCSFKTDENEKENENKNEAHMC